MSAQIKTSKNYANFVPYEINRKVEENTQDFKRLVSAMAKEGWLDAYPMHCVSNGTAKLKIKAGHHRFRAAQILGIPVKYVVCNDGMTIHELEKAGPGRWKTINYLYSFAREGLNDYSELLEYMSKTGINLNLSAAMFFGDTAGSGNWAKYNRFHQGEYRIKDRNHPKMVGDLVLFLSSLGISFSRELGFVIALSRVCRVPEFRVDRFMKKAKAHKFLITKQRTTQDYMDLIETIYNYKSTSKGKANLAFRANQAVAQRNIMNRAKKIASD